MGNITVNTTANIMAPMEMSKELTINERSGFFVPPEHADSERSTVA